MLAVSRNIPPSQNIEVLKAVNPYYAYHLLSIHPEGVFCFRVCIPLGTTEPKHYIRHGALWMQEYQN
jgi:K+ transporter